MSFINLGLSGFNFDTGASVNFTRPNNTTAYAAGDAISDSTSSPTVITFSNIGSKNGDVLLLYEAIVMNSSAAGLPNLNLWLFNTAPTPVNDNATLTLTDSENTQCIAVIPITVQSSTNANSRAEASNLQRILKLGENTKDLWALLEANGTYSPLANEIFNISLKGRVL